MPSDVIAAVQNQNVEVAAGEVGGMPQPEGQMLNATVTAQSRLQTPEQFRNIIVKADPSGARVLLSDVARVELGADNYSASIRINGHPGAGIGIYLEPGANALSTSRLVKAEMARRRAEHAGRLPCRLRQRLLGLHPAVGHRGGEDACRGDGARHPRHVRLPAELARHADPGNCDPGRAARHLRDALHPRLLDQHADPVRARARGRPARRRCHRRGRECRAHPPRAARADGQGSDDHLDAADPDGARRHRAGALGSVPADGVLRRLDRRHLPAVLGDDRLRDVPFGGSGDNLQPVARRHRPQAPACQRRADLVRSPRATPRPRHRARARRLQRPLPASHRLVRRKRRPRGRAQVAVPHHLPRHLPAARGALLAPSDRLHPRRGPGQCDGPVPPSCGRDLGPHAGRRAQGRRLFPERAGEEEHPHLLRRHRGRRRRSVGPEHGPGIFEPRPIRRSQGQREQRGSRRRTRLRSIPRSPRCSGVRAGSRRNPRPRPVRRLHDGAAEFERDEPRAVRRCARSPPRRREFGSVAGAGSA